MTGDCPSTASHGTTTAYRRNGCRCPEALDAYRGHLARDRDRKRDRKRSGTGLPGRARRPGIVASDRWAEYRELRDVGFDHDYALRDTGWTQEAYERAYYRAKAA